MRDEKERVSLRAVIRSCRAAISTLEWHLNHLGADDIAPEDIEPARNTARKKGPHRFTPETAKAARAKRSAAPRRWQPTAGSVEEKAIALVREGYRPMVIPGKTGLTAQKVHLVIQRARRNGLLPHTRKVR